MRFREGDFIETHDGLIFDVKGLVHPPCRVIAFVRYIPSLNGQRRRDARSYRKAYDFAERFVYIRENYPSYLIHDPIFGEELMEVPTRKVARHYQPACELVAFQSRSNLSPLERRFVRFANYVASEANIPLEKLGVSGSLLVGLASSASDLDMIVYGAKDAMRVNDTLREQLETGKRVRPHDMKNLKKLHRERCRVNGVSLKDYIFHESRKPFQGFFEGVEFFVRYVKNWNEDEEVYGESIYAPAGWTKARCMVTNDADSLCTPCSYQVEDAEPIDGAWAEPILEIVSFRGRFCQQARTGEHVVARGKLERVACRGETYYRLVLGNHPKDFMVTVK